MAERRMISNKIIDSAPFLRAPVSSQALYFHLIAKADDDGIVEAFKVLRMTNSSEDDLRVLVAKGFVKILNDDLVSFIMDWLEHNKIRPDRKRDSIYKNLLLQVLPQIELLEPKTRADRKDDDNGTSQGQPMDCIGKDRLGEEREKESCLSKIDSTEQKNKKSFLKEKSNGSKIIKTTADEIWVEEAGELQKLPRYTTRKGGVK
jgi:hypothetical protein